MVKFKEISKLSKKELDEKIKDLRLDLIKARISASKGGKVKIRETKKTIARMMMAQSRLANPVKVADVKKIDVKKTSIEKSKPKKKIIQK